MTKNKKVNFNKNETISIFIKYIPAFLKGFILMLFGILVLTFAYYKLQEKNDLLYFSCFFIIAISAFFTGSSTYKKLSGRGIIAGTLGTVPLTIVELCLILIFGFEAISSFVLIIIPLNFIFGAIGGIVASNQKKRY